MILAAGAETIPTQGWLLFLVVCFLLGCCAAIGVALGRRDNTRRAAVDRKDGGASSHDASS